MIMGANNLQSLIFGINLGVDLITRNSLMSTATGCLLASSSFLPGTSCSDAHCWNDFQTTFIICHGSQIWAGNVIEYAFLD